MGSDSAKARNSAISTFEFVDRKSKLDPSSEEGQVLENIRGDVELKHVSFRYPSPTRPDVQIYANLSLSLGQGAYAVLPFHAFLAFFFGTAATLK
jgi:ATP-binding cassette, subfamily B (MDR/TAP), member 1